jgi:hypothetical protein
VGGASASNSAIRGNAGSSVVQNTPNTASNANANTAKPIIAIIELLHPWRAGTKTTFSFPVLPMIIICST